MNQNLSSTRFRAFIRFVQVAGLIMVMTLCAGNALSARTVWAHPLLQGDGDGLQVSGAKLELSATPGQVYVHNMQIGIGLKSPPVDIQITANGFGEDKDGQFLPLSDQQDISPYSGRTLITGIDNTRFRLQPGQTVPVAVTITVPNDIGTHARYATVYIDSQVMSVGTAVGQKLGIIVPIVITPLDAQKTLTGNISELEVGALEVGKPITAAITVQNTGNYHYKVRGNVMITDANGQAVATVPLDLTGTSIIPTFSQRLQMSYAALDRPNGLQPGRYTLAAEVVREDGSLVGTRQTTFNVKAPLQICPGIDNSNVIVQQFNNQEPSEIDVRASAQMVIGFEGTGKVTGQVAICPYPQEPEGGPRFSAGLGEGGLGKPSLSFVMVRIDGFRQGTAHVRFHYQENALKIGRAHV